MMRSKGFTVKVLPVLLGSTDEALKSTLLDLKLAAPGADRISRLASHMSTHARAVDASASFKPQECRSKTLTVGSVASQTL